MSTHNRSFGTLPPQQVYFLWTGISNAPIFGVVFRIGQFTRFLADLDPTASYPRLALYNFLRSLYPAEQSWRPEIIEHFMSHALAHSYWQSEQSTLKREIRSVFEHFQNQYRIDLNLEKIDLALSTQVIHLERFNDLCDIVYQYMKKSAPQDFRLISLPDSDLLVIELGEEGAITASYFDQKCTIRNGFIEPLRVDLQVRYDADLEVATNTSHIISLSPHILAVFQKNQNLWQGHYLRGYTFQISGEFQAQSLAEQPPCYYPLKRFEQYFIDRGSDTFYTTLIQSLEKSLNQLQSGVITAARLEPILQRADTISEQVYIEDKYLKLLVKELRQALQSKSHQLKASTGVDSGPTQPNHRQPGLREL